MAISYVGAGAISAGANAPSPAAPTHAIGDTLIALTGAKPDTSVVGIPSGWTLVGSAAGGVGSQGINTGPMIVYVWTKVATSTTDSTGTLPGWSGVNNASTQVFAFRPGAGNVMEVVGVGAVDTTVGTPHTVTMPTNPGLTAGDYLLAVGVIPTDDVTPAQFSAETVSATGMTTVNLTEVNEWDSSTGQDMGGWVAHGAVVTGTATAAPTVSATAAAVNTDVAGPIFLVRMREVSATANKSGTDTGTLSATDTSSVRIPISRTDSGTLSATESASIVPITPAVQPSVVHFRETDVTGAFDVTLNTASGTPYSVQIGDMVVFVAISASDDTTYTGPTYTNLSNVEIIESAVGGFAMCGTATATGTVSVTANGSQLDNYAAYLYVITDADTSQIPYMHGLMFRDFDYPGYQTASEQTQWANSIELMFSWDSTNAGTFATNYGVIAGQRTPRFITGGSTSTAYATDRPNAGYSYYSYLSDYTISSVMFFGLEIKPESVPPTNKSGSDSGTISATDTANRTILNPFTVTVTHDVNAGGTSAQTASSGSVTPPANSMWLSYYGLENNNHSTLPTLGPPTGDGTFTLVNRIGHASALNWNGTTGYNSGSALYRTNVGASPSATTLTYDAYAGTQAGYYSVAGLAVTGCNPSNAPVQEKVVGTGSITASDTVSGSITLDTTPTPGNLVIVAFYAAADTGGAFTAPTMGAGKTMTQHVSQNNSGFSHIGVWSRFIDGTESNTITCSDLGNQVGMYSAHVIELAPDTGGVGNTPISGSDSGTLSATDTAAITVTIAATDSGTLSATDTASVQSDFATKSANDSGTLSASDTSVNGLALSRTDTGTLSATDISANAGALARTDTGTLSATDTAVITVTVAGVDIGTLSANELVAVQRNFTLTDTGTLSATDAALIFRSSSTTDAGTLSSTDAATIVKSIDLTDTGTLSATDTASLFIAAAISATDTGTLSATDTASLVIVFQSLTLTDSGTFSATENTLLASASSLTDAGTLSATDSASVFKTAPLTDSGTLSATEDAVITKTVALTDTGTLSVTDTASVFVFAAVVASDTGAISATESLTSSGTMSRPDSGTLSATESATVFKAIDLTDSGTISATDTAGVFQDRLGADTGTFTAVDTASVQIFGTISKSGSDSGTIVGTDTAQITPTISVTDTGTLSAVETASATGTASINDSGTLSASDTAHVFKTLTASDSGTLSATELSGKEEFEGTQMAVWNGSEFVQGTVRVWDGEDFIYPTIRVWNGTTFVLID